jgi:hypothetical protein
MEGKGADEVVGLRQAVATPEGASGEAAKVAMRFISVGCNRLVNAAAWGRNNILAYGAHNMIALYAPHVRFFLSTG